MKISILGSGEIGSHVALFCALKELSPDIYIISRNKEKAEGEAMDINQSLSILPQNVEVFGTNDYKFLRDSDIVVVCVGERRKPGMIRADLFEANYLTVRDAANQIKQYCPNALTIIVTNPLDAMTYTAWKVLQNPRKVIGMGNSLDTARYREVIHAESGLMRSQIYCLVQGVRDQDSQEHYYSGQTDNLVEKSRSTAINTIQKKGATVFAPAFAVAMLIENIIIHTYFPELKYAQPIPVSYYHEDSDTCYGEPVLIDLNGVQL